ncbi:outer membrane beta-barrel protein [Pontibacter akesuensis]|uniref:Outer membrane protein beta-barrel domain-containing protein n=1 Tax=Pontibacter akesuensis TaxID=388950 RepID=A0A1I7JJW1_9BACT|nr:outer membrane beta-barrel protein [Pontibacter akesuensis]GHA69472.1 hypothetical protein GCM10007389_23220 [Pontibacter akesuensis]SFU85428.1 hypothetical protein SAMN04487941_2953 [Pontibacter akesuensis]
MSSAANNKRGRLEEEFQRRMQDAEASPSAAVWDRIDHQLTMQESSHYKSGMLFYRQLAAACVAILLLAGGLGAYYLGDASPKSPVAQLQQPTATPSMAATAPATATENSEATTEETIAAAMQQAVRADQPSVGAAPVSRKATGAKAAGAKRAPVPAASAAQIEQAEETTASITAESIALAPGATTGADPTIWHRKPDTRYNSFFNGGDNTAAQRLFSNFEEARKSIFGAPAANGIAAATQPRTSFAGTGATAAPTNDFRKLNELAINRQKELQREQEMMVQALNDKRTGADVKVVDEKELSGDSRWTVGMAYMPSYFEQNIGIPAQGVGGISYDSFAAPSLSTLRQTNTYMADAREEYHEEIEPGFSFGVEVKTGFKLGKKWKLLSGLGFTQNTARSKSSYLIEQFEEKPGTNQKVSPGPTTIFLSSLNNNYAADSMSVARTSEYGVTYRYRHLTVPAGIQYEGNISKDWFWFAGGGVAANILIESAVLASNAEVRDKSYALNDDESPFRKLQWSGNVTAGLGKRLSNNISVAVGPEYRAYLNSMLANPGTTQAPQGKPYTIGLNMAVNYDLGPGNR